MGFLECENTKKLDLIYIYCLQFEFEKEALFL